ncbi:MAG: diguanylate cyclase [Steroidobacteraceae bacterium]
MSLEARAASPAAEQLRSRFPWLRFAPELESAYRAEQFRGGLMFLRISLGIVALSLAVIFQIEHVAMPALAAALPELLRYGVLPLVLVAAIALTFMPKAEIWYPRVMAALLPVALMVVAWIGLQAWGQGENRLFVRLIIATIAAYFLFGLPFRSALSTGLIAGAFYAGAAIAAAMPALELSNYLCMLLVANLMCAAGAYNMEHTRRTAWLEARLLEGVADRDGLTGIYNRRRFDQHLAQIWAQGMRDRRPVALLFADIDHFKAFNDRYGHQAGDEALKAIAAVLARFGSRPLDLVARYGGEEFAILLYDVVSAQAVRIAEELLAEIRALGIPHRDSDAAAVLTISVGIASVKPDARRSSAGLLQAADEALYAAKDAGRNRAQLVQEEYEHMKTGYFRRHTPGGGTA